MLKTSAREAAGLGGAMVLPTRRNARPRRLAGLPGTPGHTHLPSWVLYGSKTGGTVRTYIIYHGT